MSGRVKGPTFAIVPESVIFADVNATAKALWVVLAWHADADGRCYPGRRNLAAAIGCHEETVTRAKQVLVDAKLIECHERYDTDGRRVADDIVLCADYSATRRDSRGALRKNAEGVLRKNAEAERTKPVVTKDISVVTRGDATAPVDKSVRFDRPQAPTPPSDRHCDRCGTTDPPMLLVDSTIDPKDYTPTGGRTLCGRCYETGAETIR